MGTSTVCENPITLIDPPFIFLFYCWSEVTGTKREQNFVLEYEQDFTEDLTYPDVL